jgi:hypothetical protein
MTLASGGTTGMCVFVCVCVCLSVCLYVRVCLCVCVSACVQTMTLAVGGAIGMVCVAGTSTVCVCMTAP